MGHTFWTSPLQGASSCDMVLFEVARSFKNLPGAVRSCLRLSGATWGHQELPGAVSVLDVAVLVALRRFRGGDGFWGGDGSFATLAFLDLGPGSTQKGQDSHFS